MSFPEEPLNLSPASGGPGYFVATIGQKLNKDKYEIIRKLGYGPRSSTWLVWCEYDDAYFSVKIYTVAESKRAEEIELPILRSVKNLSSTLPLPWYQDSFWETGYHGSHFCIVTNPLSTTVEALRLEEEAKKLPVHVVQRIIYCTTLALEGLHSAEIMHGAVNAGNIYFATGTQADVLRPQLEEEEEPLTIPIGNFEAVESQPIKHSLRGWKHKKAIVSEWPLYLLNLGHAQRSTYKPESSWDYASAPETISQNPSCSLQTDIWQLGALTFKILTGSNLPGFVDEDEGLNLIHAALVTSLHKDDVSAASGFIKDCLRADPSNRLTAKEALRHTWLSKANACSCGYC
ncbi:SRSF protein kinase 1 [Psilocybe cubensis]|uniref:Protein kinase domain-containing protein n=2 Tax=Psilocybe cubensis TaxID=181762 RepID=A0A8H7Y2E2_PSICU|nr:SRSF protein kinase 1 [Psilocybe cubensis]KAH9481456.1 SRSF protein kinase 1 [Psilocybe cubensis]